MAVRGRERPVNSITRSRERPADVPFSASDLCPDDVLQHVVGIARDVGVGVNVELAVGWLTAVAAALDTPDEFALGQTGDFGGHELALIDFDPTAAARLRRVGQSIAAPSFPAVRTGLAVSGSAAQGRSQPFPADLDFFERVHITAPTRDEACARLGELIRADALRATDQSEQELEEVWFGRAAGSALRWRPADVAAGMVSHLSRPEAPPRQVTWLQAATDLGLIKLDWTVTDREAGGRVKVSTVVDATWEGPNGAVANLDGLVDADFQQVYLGAAAALLAARLRPVESLTEQRLTYSQAIEEEAVHYLRADPTAFEKVAKRLYNLCRITGRYAEAIYLRELFDEPAARLHQGRTALRLLIVDCDRDLPTARATLLDLVNDLNPALGDDEMCRQAAATCQALPTEATAELLRRAMESLDAALTNAVSIAFGMRLHAYPPIARLMDETIARVEARRDQGNGVH